MTCYHQTETPLSVRPGDLDSVGHVNNARALEYLEHGRWDWLRKNGFSRNDKIIPVVVRMEVDYGAEIPWTEVGVETHLLEDDEAVYKAKFRQRICIGVEKKVAVARPALAARFWTACGRVKVDTETSSLFGPSPTSFTADTR